MTASDAKRSIQIAVEDSGNFMMAVDSRSSRSANVGLGVNVQEDPRYLPLVAALHRKARDELDETIGTSRLFNA